MSNTAEQSVTPSDPTLAFHLRMSADVTEEGLYYQSDVTIGSLPEGYDYTDLAAAEKCYTPEDEVALPTGEVLTTTARCRSYNAALRVAQYPFDSLAVLGNVVTDQSHSARFRAAARAILSLRPEHLPLQYDEANVVVIGSKAAMRLEFAINKQRLGKFSTPADLASEAIYAALV